MSNANRSPGAEREPGPRCASTIPPPLLGGATRTPPASTTPSFTARYVVRPTRSGPSSAPTATTESTLAEHVADPGYANRVLAAAARISSATDTAHLHAALYEGRTALGVEHALFVNFVRHDRAFDAARFLFACDPFWAREYADQRHFEHDPCLLYAARHTEPIRLADLPITSDEQQRTMTRAAAAGFAGTVVVPVHTASGHSRASVLCLGSSDPDYFNDSGQHTLMRCARLMALEIHDWWVRQVRLELVSRARLSDDDLALLRHERAGHSSKQIAASLGVSTGSVNSRFQRLNAKLGVVNRREGAQLAVDAGLILD